MRAPQEVVQYVNHAAFIKQQTPFNKILVLSFLGGVYISVGALLSVVISYGFPGIAASNPSIIKLLMGAVFPVGLITIVLAGAELFTGCCAYFVPNVMNGDQKISTMFRFCTIVWVANFIGALFFGYFLVHLADITSYQPAVDGFFTIAKAKTSNPFYVTLLKGIGANWLVCLAMWLGLASERVSGKIIGIWFPIMTFVAIGYEHSVANMFFLPVAMFEGFDLSITDLFVKNLIPATLGNIIGGGLFVGGAYWYLYGQKNQ